MTSKERLKVTLSTSLSSTPVYLDLLSPDLHAELLLFCPLVMRLIMCHFRGFSITLREMVQANDDLCHWAAKARYHSLLKWGCEMGLLFRPAECARALIEAASGDVDPESLSLLRKFGWNDYYSGVIREAACNGRWKVVNWAVGCRCRLPPELYEIAATAGRLDILNFLRTQTWTEDFPEPHLTIHVTMAAAKAGHLEVLKLLREIGCPWSTVTCEAALYHGRIELLKWAIEAGCPIPKDLSMLALELRQVELLKWLVSKGASLPEDFYVQALIRDMTDLFEWAFQEGCPLDASFFLDATARGNLQALAFAKAKGAFHVNQSPCNVASGSGHYEIVKWLHQQGFPLSERAAHRPVRDGNLEFVQWLAEHGCPITPEHRIEALRYNQPATAAWIESWLKLQDNKKRKRKK